MPIDVGLLRGGEESSSSSKVQQWQSLRQLQDKNQELLKQLPEWDAERRSLLMKLQQQRHRVNTYQRWLAPKNDHVSDEDRSRARVELPGLRREVIPSLERQLHKVTSQIEESLPLIGNVVDTSLANHIDNIQKEEEQSNQLDEQEVVVDPLFSLKGYETLSTGESSSVTILTGIGATLAHSILDAAIHHFSSYTLVRLPGGPIQVDTSTWHSLLGCHRYSHNTNRNSKKTVACPACEANISASDAETATTPCTESNNDIDPSKTKRLSIPSPSIVTLSRMHQGKTYFDRQFPLGFVVIDNKDDCSDDDNTDPWDEIRRRSFQKCKRAWFHAMPCHYTKVEVFVLTGGTLTESRRAQLDVAHAMLDFLTSLLLQPQQQKSQLRLRTISPQQLLPCEASRIAVEGYLPSTDRFVILGHVSNFGDYLSRGCKTKCHYNHDEYIHTVHGTVSSIPETMEWMLQQNSMVVEKQHQHGNDKEEEKESGVGLHAMLARGVLRGTRPHVINQRQVLFVPFGRRVFHGKGGNWTIEEFASVSSPRVLNEWNSITTTKTTTTDPTATNEAQEKVPFALQRLPNVSEIASESVSCPFDFLPLPRLPS